MYRPSSEDIYKFKTKNKIFLDQFSKKLCGKFRKGHFEGVVDVVNRFIEIIKPKKIFLGNIKELQLKEEIRLLKFLIKTHATT